MSSHSFIIALLLGAALLPAQPRPRGRSPVKGEIASRNLAADGLLVEIRDNTGRIIDRAPVNPDGSFELPPMQPGQYETVVTDGMGGVVQRDVVWLEGGGMPLSIRLPEQVQRNSKPADGEVVSAKRLAHKVPGKAEKEFRRSEKAFEDGDVDRSIELLRKAIAIDPDYMEAHNNLGGRYLALDRCEEAIAEFQKAAELDPTSGMVLHNLAIALITVGRHVEAGTAARRALQSSPQATKTRYLLGIVQVQLNQEDEALENLRRTAADFPKAHLFVAQILARKGEAREAAAELRAYLATGNPYQREKVESELQRLEQESQEASAKGPGP